MRNGDGDLDLGPNWTFTPATLAAGAPAHMVAVADTDYLHFGYWLNTSENDDGETVYEIAAITGGTVLSDLSIVRTLMGSAKYAGPATGLYVKKTPAEDGRSLVPTSSGQFTAQAALTAYFIGDDVTATNSNSIDGMITNFMNGDGYIDPTWSVTLKQAKYDGATTLTDGRFTGVTEGDKGMEGTWGGKFFGDVTLGVPDEDPTVYPSGVAGDFNGHFSNGHVLGAFGADYVKPSSN